MIENRVLIAYSSKTGNTRKVAEGIYAGLAGQGMKVRIAPVEDNPQPETGEALLLGFWVDKGSADKKALKYLKSLAGQKIGIFGTLGAYPDSEHARDCARKVTEVVVKQNTCLGSFLCMGKIDPKLTAMFEKMPPWAPHAMNGERRKRHEEAAKHPDSTDIANVLAACVKMLEKDTVES